MFWRVCFHSKRTLTKLRKKKLSLQSMYCLQWYVHSHGLSQLKKKTKKKEDDSTFNFLPSFLFCLFRLIPVLLIPKPINPDIVHYAFLILHLLSFFLEKKPCTICSVIFFIAVSLICYSCWDSCVFWNCSSGSAPKAAGSSSASAASQSNTAPSFTSPFISYI